MLVKSAEHRLTNLPHTGIGSFSSTNTRSQNILSQMRKYSLTKERPFTTFLFCKAPVARTRAAITVVLWKPVARHLAGIQA